jgi:hypothetical protein
MRKYAFAPGKGAKMSFQDLPHKTWDAEVSWKKDVPKPLLGRHHASINLSVSKLGGALAGKHFFVYCLAPNPVAGENCLHFSIFGHF